MMDIAAVTSGRNSSWRRIRIGEVECDCARPCSRCVVPSIDQANGQRDPQINRALA